MWLWGLPVDYISTKEVLNWNSAFTYGNLRFESYCIYKRENKHDKVHSYEYAHEHGLLDIFVHIHSVHPLVCEPKDNRLFNGNWSCAQHCTLGKVVRLAMKSLPAFPSAMSNLPVYNVHIIKKWKFTCLTTGKSPVFLSLYYISLLVLRNTQRTPKETLKFNS
jgi:hypothetical protein